MSCPEAVPESIAVAPPEKGVSTAASGDAAYDQLEREVLSLRTMTHKRAVALEERDLVLEAMQRRLDAKDNAHATEVRRLRMAAAKSEKELNKKNEEMKVQYQKYRERLDEHRRDKVPARDARRSTGRSSFDFVS